MNNKRILIFIIILCCYPLAGQDITGFLNAVAGKNPEITAWSKLLEARKFEALTGLTPPDPQISGGYMPGQNGTDGIKKTWSVTQSFSFPGKYITQNRLSRERIILAEEEYDLARMNILLNTKFLVFDHIFNTRKLEMLGRRKELYDRLKSVWQKMLDTGEATILEYNRIKYALSGIDLEISRTKTDLAIIRQKLTYAAGGNVEIPYFSEYPGVPEIQFENILKDKMLSHPAFLLPDSEYHIGLNELKVSRYGSFPEFQAGYSSEIIPGERFTGPVAGISIPLWSNSRKIRAAGAMAEHLAAARDARIAELSTSVKGEYENLLTTGKGISELRDLIGQEKEGQYPAKALSSGEISLTDYFLYLESSYESEDRLLELENEYVKIEASLRDQELLKLTGE